MSSSRPRLKELLFPAASDTWLTLLRIGLGTEVTLYCLSLQRDWLQLFRSNGNGIVSRDLSEAVLSAQSPFLPRLGWLVQVGAEMGLGEDAIIRTIWLLLFCAGCFLLIGFFSRCAAVAAWFLHLCAIESGNLMTYGMDNFTTIGLFYLMLAPLPDRYALDYRKAKWPRKNRYLLGLFKRILQLHLCLIYFFSGLAKSIGFGWWNGTSIWCSLTSPPYNIIPVHVLASLAPLLPVLGIGVWALEIGYPIFIWLRKTRLVWFLAIIAMHVMIALTMGLYLFAVVMIVLNVAAFGPDVLPFLNKVTLRETPEMLLAAKQT
jgi:hypothetical protein